MSKIASLVRFMFWSSVVASSLIGCLSAIGLVALSNQWISITQVSELVDFLTFTSRTIYSGAESYFTWITGVGGIGSVASVALWVRNNFSTWARSALVWGFKVISETKEPQQLCGEPESTKSEKDRGYLAKK